MREGYTIVWVGWEFDVPSERPDPSGGAVRRRFSRWRSRFRRLPRCGFVDQVRTARPLFRADHTLSFGSFTEWPLFADLSLSRIQHRRVRSSGLRRHDAAHRRSVGDRPEPAWRRCRSRWACSPPRRFRSRMRCAARPGDWAPSTGRWATTAVAGTSRYIFYTNTGVEYWGGGRVASLVHSTPDGKNDLIPPDNVRVYFFAGTQHGPGAFPPPPGDEPTGNGKPHRLLVEHAGPVDGHEGLGRRWRRAAAESPPSVC